MKTLQLKGNIEIPILGFGTWQLKGKTCFEAVKTALNVGYNHIDTADVYGNHKEVGQAIKESGVKREKIFLTTKIWRDNLHQADVIKSVDRFLQELQTDYIDLLLIHWPNTDIPISETLNAFQELKNKKIVRAIGVSNFTIPLLNEAQHTGIEFVNNQVEFHPSLNQKELKEFCDKNQILITAYSPIAQGNDLKIPIIQKLSEQYKKTPAQIILSWLIKKQMIVIPRSSNPNRIIENLASLSINLSDVDSADIDSLSLHNRIVRPGFAPFSD